jgi:hypothetical protein
MKISTTMVKHYLSYLLVGWFGDHEQPPQTREEIAPYARNIAALAGQAGDLGWLTMGLEGLLSDPAAPLRRVAGGQYPFTRGELHDTLLMLWQALAPGDHLGAPGEGPTIEWVDMTAEEWVTYREWLKTV